MSLKFSVLLSVYIKENPQFLQLALNSVIEHQSRRPDEVIIVEDGPITPELDNVLSAVVDHHPGIVKRFKLDKNQGLGAALTFGLYRASNEWIARMDSDDIAGNDRFEKQLDFLERHPDIDVLGSSTEEFNNQPGDLKHFRKLPEEHEAIVKLMKVRNPLNHMTVFFRKALALKAGGYQSIPYVEDYNLWYEMKKAGARFHNLPDNLVQVRVGNNMVGRRSGYAYFRFEKLLLKKFRHDRFINLYEYFALNLTKFSLRILPTRLLKLVYKFLLRKSE